MLAALQKEKEELEAKVALWHRRYGTEQYGTCT